MSTPSALAQRWLREVRRRMSLPAAEQSAYAERLLTALAQAGIQPERPQAVLLVDRSAQVQAGFLWVVDPASAPVLVGAFPVSTGRPVGFEHFETPTGAFEHNLEAPDFRAEGTPNENGVRGYGERGRRVFDFGWVTARRGWRSGEQAMRLQVHATDPVLLEPRLGERASKGCIRVPASVNEFLDRYGLLDAAYEEALARGARFWVLRADRSPTPWSGRWLVIIDSVRAQRPAWSPAPRGARKSADSRSVTLPVDAPSVQQAATRDSPGAPLTGAGVC